MPAPPSLLSRASRRVSGLLPVALTAALAAACGGAAEVVRPLTGRAELDRVFAEYDRQGSPGCALGVIENGDFTYRRGYGQANLEHGIPLDAETVFRTGSVSKQFTGMLILLLDEQGALSLDDSLRTWVPEMPDLGPITVRHLLHHTSGLRDYLALTELAGYREQEFYTAGQLLGLLSRQQALNFVPGAEFLYSNTGYFLLGLIATRASGQSLRDLGEELIFAPLAMRNSQFYDDTTRVVPRRASGYTPNRDGFSISMTTLAIVGDGGVFTSVNDLLAWDRNFYANRLGKGDPARIRRWLDPGESDAAVAANMDGGAYGAGISQSTYRGLPVVSHGGAFVGFRADVVRFPAQQTTVITLCNVGTANASALALQVADVVLAAELGPAPEPDAAGSGPSAAADDFTLPVSQLRQYRGRYVSRELAVTYVLAIRDGRLYMSLADRWERPLVPVRDDSFAHSRTGIELHFRRDGAGAVDGLSLDWGRVTGMWFERVG